MSLLSIGLLIALIIVFISIKWDDKHKWITVYESEGPSSKDVQSRYLILKQHKIRCQLKNKHGPAQMTGKQGAQGTSDAPVLLQVHKNDKEDALNYLAGFHD